MPGLRLDSSDEIDERGVRSVLDPRRGPGSSAGADHPTRAELLDAALELLGNEEFDALSVSRITRGAGLAKGTFYVHFADRDEFLVELHHRFHDKVLSAIETATANLEPGPERLRRRLVSFLDGCRESSGARALLWRAGPDPTLRAENDRRWAEAIAAITADLTAGGPQAFSCERARLIVVCTDEVAAAELQSGKRLPRLRAALASLACAEAVGEDRI